MKIVSIVGARPNFMKVAPLHRAFKKRSSVESTIIHTGQHYDEKMSDLFFKQLELPAPDVYLGIGSGTQAEQTAALMVSLERILPNEKPDIILVVGDVNSTVAASLVAAKAGMPIVHVEAGLRSGDWSMPEEINRIVTDRLSSLLFTTEESGNRNLKAEAVPATKVHFVGNVMIDSLVRVLPKARELNLLEKLKKKEKEYALVTMHRPGNVDTKEGLEKLVAILEEVSKKMPVIFPVHPRTMKQMTSFGLDHELSAFPNITIEEPLGYLEFIYLMERAGVVITDSGGIQEETTYLGVPCLTLRPNTERPVTVELGTNELVALEADSVTQKVDQILTGQWKKGSIPPLWDGKAAERIADILTKK